jgi:E3 ubiquitin-protein ligase CHFR
MGDTQIDDTLALADDDFGASDQPEKCWATLSVSSGVLNAGEQILLSGSDGFTIGRKAGSGLLIASGKCSNVHCTLSKRAVGSVDHVFVTDSSSNGTLVNGVRLKKGDEARLEHCDSITVSHPDIFSATVLLAADLQVSAAPTPGGGKKRALDDVDADSADDDASNKKKGPAVAAGGKAPAASVGPAADDDDDDDAMLENLTCGICQEILHGPVCAIPCMHTFCAGCYMPWLKKSTDCPMCRQQVREEGEGG